jgi:hypothetical protein
MSLRNLPEVSNTCRCNWRLIRPRWQSTASDAEASMITWLPSGDQESGKIEPANRPSVRPLSETIRACGLAAPGYTWGVEVNRIR